MKVHETELAGYSRSRVYPDGTVIRVSIQRTENQAYPSGWRYTFHYGALDPEMPETLSDGTIRRYDNTHEDTKGHECHVAPDPDPQIIDFPGIVELWNRFWNEGRKLHSIPAGRTEPMTETLIVTVESNEEFYEDVRSAIETLEAGDSVDSDHTVSFPSEELLAQTFTAKTLALLRTLSKHEPESIRETARLVERDVKNVHDDLTKLEAMGIIRFNEEGQAKRPLFPFDELVINVPFPHASDDEETAAVS